MIMIMRRVALLAATLFAVVGAVGAVGATAASASAAIRLPQPNPIVIVDR
jgi:hypothetical protein